MEIIVDENLVLKEKERLQVLYKDIPSNKLKVVDGLIIQAARLRVMLDYMWEDIKKKVTMIYLLNLKRRHHMKGKDQ